jgi:PAS domain S-box-containing protein
MASAGEENSFINKPFQKFLGVDRQSLSNSWIEHLHPDDAGRVRAAFLEAMAQSRGSTDEFRIRRHDGEYRMVAGKAVPRFSPTGQFLGYAGSIMDITERRRAEEQLRTANVNLQAELAERVRREQEIQRLSARLIDAREDERKRLARELHDDVNQQIAAVSIAVGNLKRHIPAEQVEARSQSGRIHQKLIKLAESIRRMSHELHPAILEYYGLTAALRSCCDEFGALTHMRVSFTTQGSFDGIPSSTALCVYRITQEALQNIAKHAHADMAEVVLSHSGGVLGLTVSDTGIGMDPAAAPTGLGLISIKERARLLGGQVEITSRLNQGTSVMVTIPV